MVKKITDKVDIDTRRVVSWAEAAKIADAIYQRRKDEEAAERQARTDRYNAYVNNDELVMSYSDDKLLGYLHDLPEWAQEYIKDLRADLYFWKNDDY